MRLMRKRERLAILFFGVLASLPARDYGPPVGAHMQEFTLQDQNGKTQSLKSLLGPKGAMIVFFRSADW